MDVNGVVKVGTAANYPKQTPVVQESQAKETQVKETQEVSSGLQLFNQVKHEPGYIPTMQEKAILKAIEDANKKIDGTVMEFSFSIHEKTKEIMVKVIDKNSGEVIREIPNEKVLDMVAAMCEMAGIFVDEKR